MDLPCWNHIPHSSELFIPLKDAIRTIFSTFPHWSKPIQWHWSKHIGTSNSAGGPWYDQSIPNVFTLLHHFRICATLSSLMQLRCLLILRSSNLRKRTWHVTNVKQWKQHLSPSYWLYSQPNRNDLYRLQVRKEHPVGWMLSLLQGMVLL